MPCDDACIGGKTTTHALGLLEPRGTLFTGIQQEVYNGMIIGECARDGEMEVIFFLPPLYQVATVNCACFMTVPGGQDVQQSPKYARP